MSSDPVDPRHLLHIWNEILPSYIEIIMGQYKDPVINQPVFKGMARDGSQGFVSRCFRGSSISNNHFCCEVP